MVLPHLLSGHHVPCEAVYGMVLDTFLETNFEFLYDHIFSSIWSAFRFYPVYAPIKGFLLLNTSIISVPGS